MHLAEGAMSKSVEASQEGDWWSAPQAIVWIVTRDETEVAAAAGIRFLPEIERLTLRPYAGGDEPPIRSPRVAQARFISAIRHRTVEVSGCDSGQGRSVRVSLAGMIEPCLKHHDGGICVVDDVGGRWPIEYWSDLAIRSGECMRRWPVETMPRDNKQIADDVLISRVLAAVSKGKSLRAATLAIPANDIPGHGTDDSKRRRLAAKASKADKARRASK
jgi:hypothetical protein